jgi:hypothetical protein
MPLALLKSTTLSAFDFLGDNDSASGSGAPSFSRRSVIP